MPTPTLAQLLDLNEVVQVFEVEKDPRTKRISGENRPQYKVLYRGNQFDVNDKALGVFGQGTYDTFTGQPATYARDVYDFLVPNQLYPDGQDDNYSALESVMGAGLTTGLQFDILSPNVLVADKDEGADSASSVYDVPVAGPANGYPSEEHGNVYVAIAEVNARFPDSGYFIDSEQEYLEINSQRSLITFDGVFAPGETFTFTLDGYEITTDPLEEGEYLPIDAAYRVIDKVNPLIDAAFSPSDDHDHPFSVEATEGDSEGEVLLTSLRPGNSFELSSVTSDASSGQAGYRIAIDDANEGPIYGFKFGPTNADDVELSIPVGQESGAEDVAYALLSALENSDAYDYVYDYFVDSSDDLIIYPSTADNLNITSLGGVTVEPLDGVISTSLDQEHNNIPFGTYIPGVDGSGDEFEYPLSILKFAVDLPVDQVGVPIHLANVITTYPSFVEFSDNADYPSLIELSDSGFTERNDLLASDVDYIAFETTDAGQFDLLELSDLQFRDSDGNIVSSSPDFTGDWELSLTSITTATNDSGEEEITVTTVPTGYSGSFGSEPGLLIDDSTQDSVAFNELDAGLYVLKIENTSNVNAAYQLDLSKDVHTGLGSELYPNDYYTFTEDQASEELLLPPNFSWGLVESTTLPAGITLQAPEGFEGDPDYEWTTTDRWSLVGAPTKPGEFSIELLATAHTTSDIQGSKVETIALRIENINDKPVFSSLLPFDAQEDEWLEIDYDSIGRVSFSADQDNEAPVLANQGLYYVIGAEDSDNQFLRTGQLESYSSNDDAWTPIEIDQSFDLKQDGRIRWKAPADDFGTFDAFPISVSDGEELSNTLSFQVDVTAVNDLPIITSSLVIEAEEGDEESSGYIEAYDVEDIESPEFSLVDDSVNVPEGFSLTKSGYWEFDLSKSSYDRLPEGELVAEGILTVPFKVTDESQESTLSTLTFEISGVNDQPNAVDIDEAYTEGSDVQLLQNLDTLITNADFSTDVDLNSDLTLGLPDDLHPALTLKDNQLFIDTNLSEFEYLAKDETLSLPLVEFTVSDEHGASDTSALTIEVVGSNDAPVFESLQKFSASVDEDAFIDFRFADLLSKASISDLDVSDVHHFVVGQIHDSHLNATLEKLPFEMDVALYPGSPEILSSGDLILPGSSYRWSPPDNVSGDDYEAFTVYAQDDAQANLDTQQLGLTTSADSLAVIFDINPLPDAPSVATAHIPLWEDADGDAQDDDGVWSSSPSDYYVSEDFSGSIVNLVGSDPDDSSPDESNSLNYELLKGQDHFEVIDNPNDKGRSLHLTYPADYESQQIYDVQVQAIDSTGLRSAPIDLTIHVDDFQDQELRLVPEAGGTQVLLPSTTSISLDLVYSQDNPNLVADDFSAEFTFDSSRLTAISSVAPQLLGDISVSIDNANGLITVDADADSLPLQYDSENNSLPFGIANFKFVLNEPATNDMSPYRFYFDSMDGDDDFEQLAYGVTVAPNADAFIKPSSVDAVVELNLQDLNQSGRLYISTFDFVGVDADTQLEVAYGGSVTLSDLASGGNNEGVVLPFTADASFDRIVGSNDSNYVILDQAFDVDLRDGDDILDLTQLNQGHHTEVLLGEGYDSVLVPSFLSTVSGSGAEPSIHILDFELGFDAIDSGKGLLRHRDDVLSQILPGLDLDFASYAIDLTQPDSIHSIFSGETSVLSGSLAIDPGSQGQALTVALENINGDIAFDQAAGSDLWSWEFSSDFDIATLTLNAPDNSSSASSAALRSVLNQLTVSGSVDSTADLSIAWDNSADFDRSTPTRSIQLIDRPVAVDGVFNFSDSPVNVELLLPQGSTLVKASSGDDRITMLSTSIENTALGWSGDDQLITGDGNRLFGGEGDDTLISTGGTGTTTLLADSGSDLLIGGSNDVLIGGDGNDVLMVRGGSNRLSGGLGADDFILADSSLTPSVFGSYNRVIDFNRAEGDKLHVNLVGLSHDDLLITEFGRRGARISVSEEFAHNADLASRHLGVIQGISADSLSANPSLISINESLDLPNLFDKVSLANSYNQF